MAEPSIVKTATNLGTPAAVSAALVLFEEIANRASKADRYCYHFHGEFDGEGLLDPEKVRLELDRLRNEIQHLGWLADEGHAQLSGGPAASRGGAEPWFLTASQVATLAGETGHG